MSETLRTDNAEYINIRFARELERDLMRAMKERDSAWNDAITEVIALVASGKGDDQALLRQRIRSLRRKEQT